MFDADALNKTTILSGGADPIDMAARLKFCKAAKLVPAKIRTPRADERDPQVEAVHAVVILLAAMVGGPQTRTPTSVVNLWRLPFVETTGKFAKPEPRTPPVTFGLRMLDLMELAATEKFRAKYLKSFRVVNVAHGIPYASVQYFDGATEQFQAPGGPGPLSFRAPISTIALAGPAIFLELGEIVMKSRAEAKRFGVQIDTSQAFSVLNEAPVRRKTAA